MKNQNAIVFGGSGFLGSHVADALEAHGYNVRIFDTVEPQYVSPNQEIIIGDILDLDCVIEASKNCDFVYNFAALSDIDDAKNRPIEAVKLNVLGNTHILEAARLAQASRFVFASTVYVFSKSGSFYGASKQASEKFVEAYFERYGLDYTILRYGSLYGRRSDARNGVYRLLKEAITTGRITSHGDGESAREYIHVTDAAELSVTALDKKFKNRHLVLTGQERLKSKDMLRLIEDILPGKLEFSYSDDAPDGHYVVTPYDYHPKIGHKLTQNDYVDFGQGILDCISYVYECIGESESPDSPDKPNS